MLASAASVCSGDSKSIKYDRDLALVLPQQTDHIWQQWTTTYNEAAISDKPANCIGTNVRVVEPKQSVDNCRGF